MGGVFGGDDRAGLPPKIPKKQKGGSHPTVEGVSPLVTVDTVDWVSGSQCLWGFQTGGKTGLPLMYR